MTSLPPDPYAALGVPRTADTAVIKSTYRKLVLKCHPDKFPDEALKAQKQEEFQKIQQAYELIGDDEARSTYDAQVRLAELKREHLERGRKEAAEGPRVEVRSGYKVRTAAPAYYTTTTSKSSPTESKPRAYDESDRYHEEQRASSRKYDGYDAYSRRSPRSEREDKSRSEKKKTREREERRERSSKYSYVDEDDSDDRARYETAYRRRSEEDRAREELKRKAEEARKEAERQAAEDKLREARRKAEYAKPDFTPEYERKVSGARDYIERSRGGPHDDGRPSLLRVNSGSSTQFVRRSGGTPVEVRRSRAPGERRSSRDRKYPEIVESAEFKAPPLEKSYSTPANIKVTRVSPQRTRSHDHERSPPRLHRSETEPVRRKDTAPSQPSKLRESAVPHDSGYSSPSTPEAQYTPQATPKSSTTKTYRYTTGPGGVTMAAADDYEYASGHRTILREPNRHRRSPSPIRDSKHERVTSSSSRATPVTSVRYTAAMPRPPIAHANSSARVEELREERERGRDRSSRAPLYGETTHTAYRRGEKPSSSSYKMEDVHFAPRYGKDDVHFSRGYNAGYEAAMAKKQLYGEKSWDDERPRMGSRSTTTVF